MAQKVSLNLYLVRAGVSPADTLLSYDAPSAAEAVGTEVDVSAPWQRAWVLRNEGEEADFAEDVLPQSSDAPPTSLLVRSTPAAGAWQTVLSNVVPNAPIANSNQNQGALLFQSVNGFLVVWSFGNAWPLLDPSRTVERFGLSAGLNALLSTPPPVGPTSRKSVGITGLTAAIRAAVVRRSTVQTARPSSPGSMERLDQSSDAASMAELATHHDVFDRCAAGRSLRFQATVSGLGDLEKYAKEAIRLYQRDDYRKSVDYGWIDYTVPVSDVAEIDTVLNEVWKNANANPPAVVDLVWADSDLDTGVSPAYARLPREQGVKRRNLPWDGVRAKFAADYPALAGKDALRKRIRFFNDDDSQAASIELWALMVAQVDVAGQIYFLTDGEIYRASASHVADINNLLVQFVDVNPSHLPRYKPGEVEGDYNVRAAATKNHFLLDKKLLRLPGETPFEPCDLLSADGKLMHVKRKTGSATMSHVMTQALASTRLLRGEAGARKRLDEVLVAAKPVHPKLAAMRKHCASFAGAASGSVEIVIAGEWKGSPDITQLPLLTRIALNSWAKDLPCDRRIVLMGT